MVSVLLAAALLAPARLATPGDAGRPRIEEARVISVHDGDSITASVGGRQEKVRLVGIDAPELQDERPEYRRAAEAGRDYARSRLKGKTVTLESDPKQGDRDGYARLLRYVILGDGTNINEELVRKGYARVYNRFQFEQKARFKAAEAEAKRERLGIWTLPPGKSREVPASRH